MDIKKLENIVSKFYCVKNIKHNEIIGCYNTQKEAEKILELKNCVNVINSLIIYIVK